MKASAVIEAQRNARLEELEIQLRSARQRAEDASRQVEQWMARCVDADRRLDTALAIKASRKQRPLIIRPGRGCSQSAAFLIGSDWHVEETVDPTTVNGRNTFNLGIAEQRIDNFFRNGLRLVEIQRGGTDIDTLVLGLLGDHMTGYIHEELIEDNSLSPTQTILWLLPRIVAGIEELRKHFKRVIVPCCTGNHGRTTPKPRVSSGFKNSFEWLMYHVLAQRFEGTNVEFRISNGLHTWVKVFDYHVRFHHGDSIKYAGGIGGITIPVVKAIHAWNVEQKADLDVFGHWHQFIDGGRFVSNGSLIGHSAYAVRIKAAYEPPQQAFFLINRDKGKTVVAPVWV